LSDFDKPGDDRGASQAIAHTAQDKAAEGGAVVTEQASQVAGTAKEQAGRVADEGVAQARNLAQEVREQVTAQAQTQTQRLGENLQRLSQDLHDMASSAKPDTLAATAVRRIAEGSGQVADHVQRRGPEGLVGDLQDFARRRPGTFLAGAALAGFAVARLSKDAGAAGPTTSAPTATPVHQATDSGISGGIPTPAPEPVLPVAPLDPPAYPSTQPYPVQVEPALPVEPTYGAPTREG
jgi:uncharacterized protein YjbJ (UPF0337 family)